ncbi:MAG: hypothetical protein V4850_23185 [Myxococcota bacterium]
MRVDVGVSAFEGQVDHEASCPSDDAIACAADPGLPAYEHHVSIPWARFDVGLTVGTGKGWFLWGTVPVDARYREVSYTFPDGSAYEPPSPDLHHQDGWQGGLTDGRLMLFRADKVGAISWALGIGTTLPLGAPPVDPYELAEQGQPHEHLLMGSGTFVPTVTARVGVNGMRWGGSVQYDLRYPVYESAGGYFPAEVVSWNVGPSWRATPNVTLLASWESTHQDEETWHGVERGGMHMFGVAAGALWTPTPALSLQVRVRYNFAHLPHGDFADEQITKPVIVTIGGSWTAPQV